MRIIKTMKGKAPIKLRYAMQYCNSINFVKRTEDTPKSKRV